MKIKKPKFRIIDPEAMKPAGVFRIKPKRPAVFKVRRVEKVVVTGSKHQNFFKARYPHEAQMDISELHDGETYCFYQTGSRGSELKIMEGYRLKNNWKDYKRAWLIQPSRRWQHDMPQPVTNWVDVILPNGKMIAVQPRSATPSYYRG